MYKLYLNKADFKENSQLCLKSWRSFLVQDKEAGGPERIQLWEKYNDPDVLFREIKENGIL